MRIVLIALSIVSVSISCTKDRLIVEVPVEVPCECNDLPSGVQLMHYWNFNDSDEPENIFAPSYSVSEGSMMYFDADGALDYCDGATVTCWETVNDGTSINIRNNEEEGLALRLRNPGSYLEIQASTVGFENIILRYATRRTGSGAQVQQIFYATDGSNFLNSGIAESELQVNEDWELKQIDFGAIGAVNNNPDLKIRIVFAEGNTNDSGNNRFDNLTLDGNAL